MPRAASKAEECLAEALAEDPLPGWDLTREYRFHPERRWRWDISFPSAKLAIEIDGRGRHQTIAGARSDCEKQNEAVRLGWRVLRFPATDKAKAREWAALIREILCCPPSPSNDSDESQPPRDSLPDES